MPAADGTWKTNVTAQATGDYRAAIGAGDSGTRHLIVSDRKVLVHCQINMRASSLVFLHRTIALKEDPRVAYEAVTAVWSPRGPWRALI